MATKIIPAEDELIAWYNKEVRTQPKNCVTTNVVIPLKTATSATN